MKVLVKSLDGIDPREGIKIGDEIACSISSYGYNSLYTDTGAFIPKSSVESPIERLERLAKTASKMIISIPGGSRYSRYNVDVVQTASYLIVYSHSKGNHWNIAGNHFKYYHDVNTGEFIPAHEAIKNEKPEWSEKLVKKVAEKIQKINQKLQPLS